MASRSLTPFGGPQRGLARGGGGAGAPYFSLLREVNRLFDDTLRGTFGMADTGGGSVTALTPRINISETDNEIRIEAEMPGVSEDNVQIELIGDMLTIRGEQEEEREEDRGQNYHVVERVYGTFLRTIQLPYAVDPEQIQASFENGVLTITVPKSAAESKVHRVPLSGGGASARGGSAQEGSAQAGSGRSQRAGSSGIDRAAAGDKPGSAASAMGAGEASQGQSAQGQSAQGQSGQQAQSGQAQSGESGQKSRPGP